MIIDLPIGNKNLQLEILPETFLFGLTNWEGFQECACGCDEIREVNVYQIGFIFFTLSLYVEKTR